MSSVSTMDAEAVGRRALSKATWRLVPLIALGYAMAGIDRKNIGYAALTMNRDLHLSAAMYGLGAGLFFLSYSICQVPCNLLLCRIGARRWLGGIMCVWGVLASGMMLVRTPMEFYGLRFLLGMAEAGFFPGVIFTLSQWFPPAMRARTISRFYIAWPLSGVVMGIVAGALLGLDGKWGLTGWQWLFLVEGLPSVVLGVIAWKMLSDGPADADWLDADEKAWFAAEQAKEPGAGALATTMDALKALRDPRVPLIGVTMFTMLSCDYGFQFFGPLMLRDMTHLSNTNVGYLIAAMTVLGAPAMLLNAMHSDAKKERFWHVIVPFALMAAGYGLSAVIKNTAVAVAAMTIAGLCLYSMQGPIWAIATKLFGGKQSAAAIGAMNTIAILGGYAGPYWMGALKDATGGYPAGLMAMAGSSVIGGALTIGMMMQAKSKGDHGLEG